MNDKLWYASPARAWEESLPVGCGALGANVFGDPINETLTLNEDTLWSGTPRDKNNKNAKKYLPEIRRLLDEGDVVGAEEIINRYTLGDMCETYLPFADLKITSDNGDISDYRRELDILRGVFKMTCKKDGCDFSQAVFASYPARIIVIMFSSSRPQNFSISLTSKLKYSLNISERGAEISGIAPESNLPTVRGITPPTVYGNEQTSDAIRFFGAVEIITDGRRDGLCICGARELEIRVSLATSFISPFESPRADAKARALAPLEKAKSKNFDELLGEHVRDFLSLSQKFDISLGSAPDIPTDERLIRASRGESDPAFAALLVKYGRYLMISSSRPGSRATNLQGIWNEKLHPAWCSNYTVNINTEMNYWGAEPTGLSECAEPLFDFISERAQSGAKTADLHYGARGWVCHANSDIWAYTTSCGPVNERRGCSRYATWQGASGWLCRHLWEHYEITQNVGFLKKYYPIMTGAARFYLDFMVEKDGYLKTSPSLSPENIYFDKDGNKVSADVMPTMDKFIITELFQNCLAAASILGERGGIVDEIKAALSKIEPPKINSDGTLSEWSREYTEAEPDHRHVSHLYGLYPSDAINKNTKDLLAAAKKTLDRRGTQGTGWGIMWKTCLYARIGSTDRAYDMFRLIYNRLPPNAPMGNTGGGLYDSLLAACPPFQIDANFGAIAAVCEMLVRDTKDGVELLPACPAEWKEGEIRGYRLKDGRVLDFSWRDGKVTKSVIHDAL